MFLFLTRHTNNRQKVKRVLNADIPKQPAASVSSNSDSYSVDPNQNQKNTWNAGERFTHECTHTTQRCENQQKSSGYHAYISKTAQPNNNRYKPVSKHSFGQPANLRLAILASSTRFINYSCRTRACAVQYPHPLARAVVSSSSRALGHGLVQSEKYRLNRSKDFFPPKISVL